MGSQKIKGCSRVCNTEQGPCSLISQQMIIWLWKPAGRSISPSQPVLRPPPFAGRFSPVSALSKPFQDISPSRSDSSSNKTKFWKPSGVCCRSREWKQWGTTWSRFLRPTSTTCVCSWTHCWATRGGWRENSSTPSTWLRTSRRSKSWANALLTRAGAAFLLSTSLNQLGNPGESRILEFPAMTFSQGKVFSVTE